VTWRPFGIELRKSVGLVVGALIGVLMLWLLLFLSGPWQKGITAWNTQWTSLAEWERYLLVFVWPLALGAGAMQGQRDHVARMVELLDTVPLPRWRRQLPAAVAVAVGLGLSYLLVLAVGAVRVAATSGYFHLDWLPIAAVGTLALIGAGWFGMGLGQLVPSRLTPPLVTVAGLITMVLLLQVAGWPALFLPGLAGVQDVFHTVSPAANLGQALWFGGLGLTGLVLLAVRGVGARLAAFLPAVVGAVTAVSL
jgi:hypothetical protein